MEQSVYLNWEQRYYLEQQHKYLEQQNRLEIKIKTFFEQKYPELSFADLQRQNNRWRTDDNCTHYKHNLTDKIFSWNDYNNEWEDNNEYYPTNHFNLFTEEDEEEEDEEEDDEVHK